MPQQDLRTRVAPSASSRPSRDVPDGYELEGDTNPGSSQQDVNKIKSNTSRDTTNKIIHETLNETKLAANEPITQIIINK
jgi:hypothetical protein